MAKIHIPTPLRKFASNQAVIESAGTTVKDSLATLTDQHPALKKHLLDDSGNLRRFVRVYLGDEDIQSLDGEATSIDDKSVISIIPAIAGGKQ
ncbi:MAG: MoaD/ThiS family protein [Bacteroidota bacterium]